MKLSEVPEGMFVNARYGHGNSRVEVMRHDGKFAYYQVHGDDPSTLALEGWVVAEDFGLIETLKARIAEPEAALAKATRPAPAVGQVWRDQKGVDFWITREHGGSFQYVTLHGEITAPIDRKFVINETDTYIGQFAGFKVEND